MKEPSKDSYPLVIKVEGEPQTYMFPTKARRTAFVQGFREAMSRLGNDKGVSLTKKKRQADCP